MLPGAIDVHSHFLPPVYAAALADRGIIKVDGGIPIPSWSPEAAVALMDELGITKSILSVSSPFTGFMEATGAVRLASAVNDYAAELVRRRPARFGSFALLPWHDVPAARAEARRAIVELDLQGVVMPTNMNGLAPGDPIFTPLFDELAELDAVIFVHPTSPCCLDQIGLGMPGPMIEFPFDTTRAVVSLIYSGAMARYCGRIRFILPHLGGALPFLSPRIASIGAAPYLGERAIDRITALTAFDNLVYDTAGLSDRRQFQALRQFVDVSRILFGSDYPFAPASRVRGLVEVFQSLELTPEERSAILFQNASALLGLTVDPPGEARAARSL